MSVWGSCFLKNWYFSRFLKLKRPVSFSKFSFFSIFKKQAFFSIQKKQKKFQAIYRTTTPHFIQFNWKKAYFFKNREKRKIRKTNGAFQFQKTPKTRKIPIFQKNKNPILKFIQTGFEFNWKPLLHKKLGTFTKPYKIQKFLIF